MNIRFLIAGTLFGFVLVKSEVVSWFRIQEMFHLESFHMYGVIGSAILTGAISIGLIKKFSLKTIDGAPVRIPSKQFHKGQVFGGLIFGLGWAMTGACPGPLFAQAGSGYSVVVITLLGALSGTWVYGWLKEKLPH
ncbi:MAG TPA: DUF6691 family protein [Anseongella sp.]|nr:DUF6691 family protein [Anseongella sp.]